jgi:hypothetical protein
MIELKNPIKMSKIRKNMSPPIPLVMRIIILFDWRIELPNVSLGIRILILNPIGEKIILDFHWFMEDEEVIDWRERFPNFHWTRKTSSKRGHGKLTEGVVWCVFFSEEK